MQNVLTQTFIVALAFALTKSAVKIESEAVGECYRDERADEAL